MPVVIRGWRVRCEPAALVVPGAEDAIEAGVGHEANRQRDGHLAARTEVA
jgi:hypothetical protein